MYDFDEQLKEGEGKEAEIDNYFGKWYAIVKATPEQQRMGIDRIWKNRTTGTQASVEYKSDWTAARTNNVFIETVSVDYAGKQGWAYTSLAQYLAYYIPPIHTVYFAKMTDVKEAVGEWQSKYQPKEIPNGTYKTVGIPVPLPEFVQTCSCKEIVIDGGPNA